MPQSSSNPDMVCVSTLAAELRVLAGKLKRRLREQTPLDGVTWSQVAVLVHLERIGPVTVTTLARADGMRPQSMGAIVSALEKVGFVSGSPDPDDGRQTIWSLTDAGRKCIRAGRAAREDWLSRAIQAHLAPKEQEQLASTLELLKRLVES